MDVMEKARELGQIIKETEEYKELEEAGKIMQGDPEALQLIKKVQEVQRDISQSQQSGVMPTAEQLTEFEKVREEMHSNEKVQIFVKAQEKFNKVMEEINNAISDGITDEEEEESDG